MSNNADFRFEILKYAPGATGTLPAPVTLPVAMLDGFGSINRAAERDLLSFKTGDVTLTFLNKGGFFDDLFAFFGPTDRWQLRIYRRGEIQFWGVVLALGSILFNRKEKTVEITAYGLTRQMNDITAETVKRTIAVTQLTANATAGATSLTVDSTTGLETGDVLHLTNQVIKEDVTVKQVTSSTTVALEAVTVNGTYGPGTTVTCTTPFYRYKTIDFLVRALFAQANIAISDLRIDQSQFKRAAPTPVSLNNLPLSGAGARRGGAEQNGKLILDIVTTGNYSQVNPDNDWVVEDATDRAWIDWSRYFLEGYDPATPPMHGQFVRSPTTGDTSGGGASGEIGVNAGFLFLLNNNRCYSWRPQLVDTNPPENTNLIVEQLAVDGVTWGAGSRGPFKPPHGLTSGIDGPFGVEYDPHDDLLYAWIDRPGAGTRHFYQVDPNTGIFTDLKQADDVGATGYYGAVYVPSKQYVIALRGNNDFGPSFDICAFKLGQRLWKRAFPNVLIKSQAAGEIRLYPTYTLREMGGSFYLICISDGAVQFLRTDDEFQTYTMRKVFDATTMTRYCAMRYKGTYRFFAYSGSVARGFGVAAPSYAGVVSYADFTGKSLAEALKDLAVLCNALFWIDDDGAGHFVARDLYDPGQILDTTGRVKDRLDSALWDQSVQYVEVTGGGFDVTAGDKNFSSSGLSLDSPLAPNEAFDQALADDYADFYARRRAEIELTLIDPDGHIYRPLDRVTLDGLRYLVYESDHDLVNDEVRLTVLEDV